MSNDDPLPFDLGAAAYRARKLPSENPFPAQDWRHEEWYLGWSSEEEGDSYSFDWTTGMFKETEGDS